MAVRRVLEGARFDDLLAVLRGDGYRVVGPTVRDGVVVHDDLASASELPAGLGTNQEPGRYRVTGRGDGAFFGHAPGPVTLRRFLSPPRETLFRARRSGRGGIEIVPEPVEGPPLAFVGARPCEAAALAIQDRVLAAGEHPDEAYRARRERALVVVASCTEPGGTCFCASMGAGPAAGPGADVALTEVADGGRHHFVVEAPTERGEAVVARLGCREATAAEAEEAEALVAAAASRMGRRLDVEGLRERLLARYDDPRWERTGDRCLGCANCTMVCPTCFCVTVEDTTDLGGGESARERRWDSCFHLDHSVLHGGSIRASSASRYRQWLVHKLATWHDQFGTPGCVGCGRCITWCPAGIDITEEAAALRGGGS